MSDIDVHFQKNNIGNQVNKINFKHSNDTPIMKLFAKNREFYVYDAGQNA